MSLSRADLEGLLNPEQFRAATTTEGPLLILAGAGSGKTRVLVHRTAFILSEGLAKPWQMFAVTFTNKAAGEMKERLTKLIGPNVREAWIGTFHALCARMLRMEGHRLGYTQSFTIYDSDDAKGLVRSIMSNVGIDPQSPGTGVNAVANEIDRAKNAGILPAAFEQDIGPLDLPAKRAARRVYKRYQRALQRSNAMDFGDLLLLAVELLKRHPEARDRFARRFRYVQVDEFQDTNSVQYELLRLLVSEHDNLAVVGDDDQAIYRWRGADVSNILGFSQKYPSAMVVKLEQNYRSTSTILEAANAVIRQNSRRHDKTLFTEAEAGHAVGLAMLERGEEEADLIAMILARRIRDGQSPKDFAILYRQNAQSRPFEDALRRHRVPYVLIGGTAFYERREVKDIVAYLRVIANPTSRQDLARIINVPPRGIGKKTVERLQKAADDAEVSGSTALDLPNEALEKVGLKSGPIKKLRELRRLLSDLRHLAQEESAADVARDVIRRTSYERYLKTSEPATADDRIENIQELVSSIAEHELALAEEMNERAQDEEESPALGLAGARTPLAAFLDEAALVSPADTSAEGEQVGLLTLHAAKGLEFEVVFMVGMEEHTFPTRRAVEEREREPIEEERRLCYVGMTRAKRELNLSCVRARRIYGRMEPRHPSRFLGELPNQVVGQFPAGGAFRSPAKPQAGAIRRPALRPPSDDLPVHDVWSDVSTNDSEPFGPGARVFHNSFGTGVVQGREGTGPTAKLTIRFGDLEKRVVARFVSSVEDSC